MTLASSLGADAAVAGVTADTPYMSCCTGSPGTTTTAANEVSGGGYARQSITWGSAASSQIASSNAQNYSIPASTTVSYVGLHSASSGTGDYYQGGALTTSQTFSTAGTLTFAIGAVVYSAS